MLEELRHEADAPVVKAKIFNKEAITIYGSSAAKYFMIQGISNERCYAKLVLKTFWSSGVQTLDGAAHHHRKIFYGSNDTGKNGRLSSYLR